mgnify:CR=1 FL=1
MSWLSKKWDQLSGKNQKVSTKTIDAEYNKAFEGARDTYGTLEQRGLDMMDPNSAFNLEQKERMEGSAADAAAMSARMAGRNAAMSGGSNAASLAAQSSAGANQAQSGAIDSYNKYLSGAMSQGAGMASGAANNLAQMNQTQMNAVSNQRLANAQIDSQATGLATNLLGKGLSMVYPGLGMNEGGSVNEGLIKSVLKDEMIDGGSKSSSLDYSKGFEDGGEMWDYQEATGMKTGKDVVYTRGKDGQLIKHPTKHYGGLLSGIRNFGENLRGPQRVDELPEGWSPADMDKEGSDMYMQDGGYVESRYGNSGGMLSQVMGPDGIPMNIKTRIGGQYVG